MWRTIFVRARRSGAGSRNRNFLYDARHGVAEKNVAETVFPKAGGKSIKQFISETMAKGVRLVVCAPSLALNDMTEDDLIDEADNLVGTAYLIKQGLEADLVLTF